VKPPTIISYGGGVQSTAMLVLALDGKLGIDVDAAVFSNVGDDSEHPASLDYVRNVAIPRAAAAGFPVHEIGRVLKDGTPETLYGRLMKSDSRSLDIPVRMPGTGAPGSRSCTADFKIAVIGKWLKANGASKDTPATVCIGISTDEIQRVNRKRAMPYEAPVYPLIDLGLNRSNCIKVIADAGWPVPGKSSCYFCPFHRLGTWADMRRDEPELFDKAAALEAVLNERRDKLGKDHVYLTSKSKPLPLAIRESQDTIPGLGPDMDTCDSGHCWT
jgi:hypothetical protein